MSTEPNDITITIDSQKPGVGKTRIAALIADMLLNNGMDAVTVVNPDGDFPLVSNRLADKPSVGVLPVPSVTIIDGPLASGDEHPLRFKVGPALLKG